MIPPSDPATGHLPCGRYQTDFYEVHARYVVAPEFDGSETRPVVWEGLVAYLAEWDATTAGLVPYLPGPLLLRVWLGGSFVSAKVDPGNADVTLVLSADAVRAAKGQEGSGRIARLTDRADMLRRFLVSPVVLRYERVPHVFRPEALDPVQREYLATRGAWDDWWQRVRPAGGPKGPPTLDTTSAVRGYLEVTL